MCDKSVIDIKRVFPRLETRQSFGFFLTNHLDLFLYDVQMKFSLICETLTDGNRNINTTM